MKPKFAGGQAKRQTPMEPVFDFNANVENVVNQIVVDLREKSNDEIRKSHGVAWKELEGFNCKMAGDVLQISVTRLDGSLRMPQVDPKELQKRLKETYDCLHKFEKALREEFRKRTKKALTWQDPKEHSDYQLVAMNGLYQFVAKKIGKVKTVLPGQVYARD